MAADRGAAARCLPPFASMTTRRSGIIRAMAEELLERVLREIGERRQAAQGAYNESRRLEQALAALDAPSGDSTRVRGGTASRRRERPRRPGTASGAKRSG